jgi:thiol-disulfide isomerase/thioredoxin
MKTKKLVAIGSSLFAILLFIFQRNQPVNAVALMKEMEKDSISVKEALCNGKPTLIDFYADWCESCKVMAPTMRELESKYGNNINFITLDGTDPNNSEFVSKFKVDGIPHVAFITSKAEVKTALVGAVPSKVLVSDIKALLKNEELPYEGYDAFEDQSHFPFKDLSKICSI